MGLLGFLLLIDGIGLLLMGIIGIGYNLWIGDWLAVLQSAGIAVGGLISGAIATAILE